MERVTLRLPESEVKGLEILAEAGCHPNRSEGIREAVSEYINGVADNPEAVDALANMYLEERISFDRLADFVGVEEARRIRDNSERSP